MNNINLTKIIGLNIACLTFKELMDIFDKCIEDKKKLFCIPVNLDVLRKAYIDKNFYKVLNNSDLIIADGFPLIWFSRFNKNKLPERIAGSDLFIDLCNLSNKKGYKVFMLGAAEGVADKAKLKLEESLPNVKIVGTYSPSPQEINEDSNNLLNMINESGAEILFVAFGAPKQENWISKNYDKLNPYIILPCGASIDFAAGEQIRSPKWMIKLNIEWVFRLLTNPKRLFRRYIIEDTPFFVHLTLLSIKNKLFPSNEIETKPDNLI